MKLSIKDLRMLATAVYLLEWSDDFEEHGWTPDDFDRLRERLVYERLKLERGNQRRKLHTK